MASHGKGTVTPLSSIFPSEEARKASERVNAAISEKNKELDTLNHFTDDNNNLINQVHRLPDALHHNIMVPFGKAAFFPGRLVHTNEFLVLLGENYFAERTAKQTVDILNRRGKTLNSQVESLKAAIEDLKAEASFFDKTAAEAVEGLVEIREEYSENDSGGSPEKADARLPPTLSKDGNGSSAGVIDDDEYDRMMSRLDELEKEELAEEDLEEHGDDTNYVNDEDVHDLEQEHLEDWHHAKEIRDADKLIHENLSLQSKHRDKSSYGKGILQHYGEESTEQDLVSSVMKTGVSSESKPKSEVHVRSTKPDDMESLKAFTASIIERTDSLHIDSDKQNNHKVHVRSTKPDDMESLKAFTASIIERTDSLHIDSDKQNNHKPSNPYPAKPVSRFKMQRRAV